MYKVHPNWQKQKKDEKCIKRILHGAFDRNTIIHVNDSNKIKHQNSLTQLRNAKNYEKEKSLRLIARYSIISPPGLRKSVTER